MWIEWCKEIYVMWNELYKYVCKLWLLRMCMLLDTRLTISAVYLKLYYKVKSGNVWEIVFNSECFNSDLEHREYIHS